MRRVRRVTVICLLLVMSIHLAGCGNKFFDPAQVGRFRPTPAVNVILDSLGVAEETPPAWEGAQEPKPVDTMVYETDYVFNAGDILRITIFELLQAGQQYEASYVITETGKLSIPEVGVVEAVGLTETQLEEEIKRILSPSILKDPSVTVTLLSSERRVFSILGSGVPKPGRYSIPRYDFRLLDALAVGGGISQFNISYVFVTRAPTGKELMGEPTELFEPREEFEPLFEPEQEMLEMITPQASRRWKDKKLVVASAEMITDQELTETAIPEEFESWSGAQRENTVLGIEESSEEPVSEEPFFEEFSGQPIEEQRGIEDIFAQPTEPVEQEPMEEDIVEEQEIMEEILEPPVELFEEEVEEEAGIEWIFQNGKWIPVQPGRPMPTEPMLEIEVERMVEPLEEMIPEGFGLEEVPMLRQQARVIKIPAELLLAGDPRYNIVIRAGDTIHVPVDIIGEFCIMGNVNKQGYINITGRPMTLKMAIAAAGGLGPLSWPKRCEVVRRIGKDKEEIVMLDLDKIASGEQPDFFIKPNDLINVGTHPTSRWRAVLRNAFRATYGFGFIYDRNFAYPDRYYR